MGNIKSMSASAVARRNTDRAQAELAKQQRLDKLKALRDKPNRGLKEINEIIDILLEKEDGRII